MSITDKEKARRVEANRQRTGQRRQWRRAGLCRCGSPVSGRKMGTGRPYATCGKCHNEDRRRRYEGALPKPGRKPTEFDPDLADRTGVRRRKERDGLGREAWWWLATINLDRVAMCRRFSVDKYGDNKAYKMALAQRLEWEKQMLV